jgi:hypothetical protein
MFEATVHKKTLAPSSRISGCVGGTTLAAPTKIREWFANLVSHQSSEVQVGGHFSKWYHPNFAGPDALFSDSFPACRSPKSVVADWPADIANGSNLQHTDGPETAHRARDGPLLTAKPLVGGFFMPVGDQFSGLRHSDTSVADPLG